MLAMKEKAALAFVLLLATVANGELILDNPAGNHTGRLNGNPNDGGIPISENPFWPAQKFSVNEPTVITEVEAYIRRRFGNEHPNIAIYTDDGGDPGENGLSLPDQWDQEQNEQRIQG